MAGLRYWLWLTTRRSLGRSGMQAVLEAFGTPERAYEASPAEHRCLPPAAARALADRSMDEPERIRERCERLGVRILTIQDAGYPTLLRQLYDAPLLLYWKGTLPDFDERVPVAVVGTRQATRSGCAFADRLGQKLAEEGAVVVSGIARGIDGSAVRGALRAGGAPVCVLAGGVDMPYPREHMELYRQVAERGLLIGEYPPGTPNKAEHFPIRNRIISGLSMGVVVVEAKEHKSGALITANHALEQDRDVFAVPGPVDAENSRGCIRLLQQGAKPVMDAEDVLEEYRAIYPARLKKLPPVAHADPDRPGAAGAGAEEAALKTVSPQSMAPDEVAVLRALAGGPAQADELVARTGLDAPRVLTALTMLQISGSIEERPGRRFERLVRLTDE